MRIMVRSKGEKGWKPLDESHYDSEAHLQELLNKDISLIPLDPPLLVSASEFGLPGSGATDIIAVNQDGAITIIECKLAKSRDVRRMVVGQLLEYAAYLAKMSADEFVETFDRLTDAPLYETIASKLEDFEESMFKENLAENLNDGRFTLIVAVDSINEELREIILYLNAHSDCTVGALELEYFKDDKRELLVPRLYGGPEAKEAAARQSTKRTYRKWNKESFFEAAAQHLDDESLTVLHDLYDFTEKEADELKWGTAKNGAFGFRAFDGDDMTSIFYVFGTGKFWIHFNFLRWVSEDIVESLNEFRRKLNTIPGVSLDETRELGQDAEVEYTGVFNLEALRDKSALKTFKEAVLWMRDKIRSYDE